MIEEQGKSISVLWSRSWSSPGCIKARFKTYLSPTAPPIFSCHSLSQEAGILFTLKNLSLFLFINFVSLDLSWNLYPSSVSTSTEGGPGRL